MLDPLYHLAANAIVFFHKGFGPIFGQDSFFAWAFSVVLLVVCVRILIFPLFVRQVKSQRTMQLMQPRIKEIREKYGHDKQVMQQKMMDLQKEHGNPLLGCLPIFLQIPLFLALFHVFTHLSPMNEGPGGSLIWRPRVGLSADQVEQIASAKVFGISLATSFTSKSSLLDFLHANGTHVKIVAVVLIVLMGATTFFTQRQIMSRTGPTDPQQAMVQKVLLYGSPVMLAIFGFRFPIAVLIYWLTTNLWSMGQQFYVIRRMPPMTPDASGRLPGARPATAAAAAGDRPTPSRPAPGAKPAPGARTKGKGTAAGTRQTSLTKATPPATANGAGTKRNTTSANGSTVAKSGSAPAGTRSPRGGASNRVTQPPSVAKDSGTKDSGTKDVGITDSEASPSASGSAAPTPAPVPAGVTRHVGGSRPAAKRKSGGKGKRPGGRR
ncbi:membrane protein insertase YidC [Pseudofrankia saprophytica]|uniref:membrane protein insertase YidC n=1 Tax=Pseudofrankia saprophytica TaxID=298655 RepID=UPI000234C1E7|nr:membrane protein insertase YidC [Pseudofrankia saprophytica]